MLDAVSYHFVILPAYLHRLLLDGAEGRADDSATLSAVYVDAEAASYLHSTGVAKTARLYEGLEEKHRQFIGCLAPPTSPCYSPLVLVEAVCTLYCSRKARFKPSVEAQKQGAATQKFV